MEYILYLILVGLVAGVLAKAIMPGSGNEPHGWLMTIVLGIAGSLLVGFIVRNLMGADTNNSLIATIIGATIGACLLIFLFRMFTKKSYTN